MTRNELSLTLFNRVRANGVESLSGIERAYWDVEWSWGLIWNSGMHNFIVGTDDVFPVDRIVESFHALGLPGCAACVFEAAGLLFELLGDQIEGGPVTGDALRAAFGQQFDELETRFLGFQNAVIEALEQTARRLE